MNWIDMGLAGASALLAIAISSLLVRRPRERRGTFALVLLVSFAALAALSRAYLFPRLNAWSNVRDARAVPALQILKQRDPRAYDDLLSYLRHSVTIGLDRPQLLELLRAHLDGLLRRRLPHAPDAAVVAYTRVVLAEMNELRNDGGGLCYRFLFPQTSAPLDRRQYLSEKTLEAELAATVQVIAAARRHPRPLPAPAVVTPELARLTRASGIGSRTGLPEPADAAGTGVDPDAICTVDVGLLSRILQLPHDRRGAVLRFVWSRIDAGGSL